MKFIQFSLSKKKKKNKNKNKFSSMFVCIFSHNPLFFLLQCGWRGGRVECALKQSIDFFLQCEQLISDLIAASTQHKSARKKKKKKKKKFKKKKKKKKSKAIFFSFEFF
jgi:hypothetical protein